MTMRSRHSADTEAGISLVELLVVLACLALAAMVVLPKRPRPAVLDLDIAGRLVVAKLTEARARAIGRGGVVHVDIDPASRRIAASGDATALALPSDIDMTLTTARSWLSTHGGARITFHPDGSATGGTLSLGRGDRRVDVVVSWLTGQVALGVAP